MKALTFVGSYTKYGYPFKTLEVPPINGERGFIVDYAAWQDNVRYVSHIL